MYLIVVLLDVDFIENLLIDFPVHMEVKLFVMTNRCVLYILNIFILYSYFRIYNIFYFIFFSLNFKWHFYHIFSVYFNIDV